MSNQELANLEYQAGKDAFERGRYQQSVQRFEKAISLLDYRTKLGGETQLWLVNAYEAAGLQTEAIALCEKMTRHPDLTLRKQSSRLLYILKAPRLRTRPEWLTQIPDLTNLEDSTQDFKQTYAKTTPKRSRRPKKDDDDELKPIDLSQVNTKDNRFVWVALGAVVLTIGWLVWQSQ
ncbi:MAG TPA: tetratricopeptide repeat protein [Chroococcidiopsis sp.]